MTGLLAVATVGNVIDQSVVVAPLIVTDDFTGTNGVQLTTYSANWTLNTGDFDIQSNALAPDQIGIELAAHWNANVFSDNQYAEATIAAASAGGRFIGVAVRMHASAATYYGFYYDSSAFIFFSMVEGTLAELDTILDVPTVGQRIRIEANGTTIRALIDDVEVGSAVSALIASGSAGVCGAGDVATVRIDAWEAGDL